MKTNKLIVDLEDISIIRYSLESYLKSHFIDIEDCKSIHDLIFIKEIFNVLINVKICEGAFYEERKK